MHSLVRAQRAIAVAKVSCQLPNPGIVTWLPYEYLRRKEIAKPNVTLCSLYFLCKNKSLQTGRVIELETIESVSVCDDFLLHISSLPYPCAVGLQSTEPCPEESGGGAVRVLFVRR